MKKLLEKIVKKLPEEYTFEIEKWETEREGNIKIINIKGIKIYNKKIKYYNYQNKQNIAVCILDKEYNPLKEEEIISEIGENNILDQLYENLKSKINIYNNAISEMENYIYKGE